MSKSKPSNAQGLSVKPSYKIGDLLWCRETKRGNLWWPAMVSYDPNVCIFFKRANQCMQYHVQYFGISAVRGWVYQGAIQRFTDPQEKVPPKGMSKKARTEYEVAIKEVTEAYGLDHKQRKLRFIFNFAPKNNRKRKSKLESRTTQPTAPQRTTIKTEQREKKRDEVSASSATNNDKGTLTSTAPLSTTITNSMQTSQTPKFVVPQAEQASEALSIPIQLAEVVPMPSKPLILPYSPPLPQVFPFPLVIPPRMNVPIHDSRYPKPSPCSCLQCVEGFSMGTALMPYSFPLTPTQAGQFGMEYQLNGSFVPLVKYSTTNNAAAIGPSPVTGCIQVPLPQNVPPIANGVCATPQPPTHLQCSVLSRTPIENHIATQALPSVAKPDNMITSPIPSTPIPRPSTQAGSSTSTAIPAVSSSSSSSSVITRMSSSRVTRSSQRQASLSKRQLTADSVPSEVSEALVPIKRPSLVTSIIDGDNSSEISMPSITSAILTPPNSGAEESSSSVDFEFDRSQTSSLATDHRSCCGGASEQPKPKKRKKNKEDDVASVNCGMCYICDQEGTDLLCCEGQCYSMFHLDCLGLMQAPNFKFVCDECLVASTKCFVCGHSDGELLKCNKPRCSKLYHMSCLSGNKLVSFDEKKKTNFTCPLHVCARCTSIGTSRISHTNLLQCTKCPLAFHRPDCLVAGCEILNQTHMVCYKHVKVTRNVHLYSHLNMNTCLECGDLGSLFCCDICSSAYHMECLDEDSRPSNESDSWKCPNCTVHDLPVYGSVVLCKFGKWRWWPSEVIHPDDIPDNLLTRNPGECMFVVRFCGSQEYGWTYHGRVLPYIGISDDGPKSHRKKTGMDNVFKRACAEAMELCRSKKVAIEAKEAKQKSDSNHYIKIKVNKYLVPRPTLSLDSLDFLPCQCTPKNPCKDDSTCVNRAIHIECDPKTCPVGEACQNQRIKKGKGANTTPFYTGNRGWGLKANCDLSVGDFVVEYVGEVLDMTMCKERLKKYHENNTTNFYMLTLDGGLVIDASQKSNHARFINHSCNPNCESQKWRVRGEPRIGIFACQNIPAGTELTFDYHLDSLGNDKKECLCGSKNCSGFLGVKSKTAPPDSSKVKTKSVQKTKRRKQSRTVKNKHVKQEIKEEKMDIDTHEDDCFFCNDGGDLLLCDKKGCTKAYHLECTTRKELPSESEKWICPRHYCQVCQKPANVFCPTCPVSYCAKHSADRFEQHPETGEPVCVVFCKELLKCTDRCGTDTDS